MERKEAVKVFLDKVVKAYIDDQKAKGIRASGYSADNLKPEAEENYGKILGAAYITQQKFGRKPGKLPPIEAIIQWLKDKHLELNAWAVAKSIAKKGTRIFQGRAPALSIEGKLLEARKELATSLASIEREKFIQSFKDKLKT